MPTDHGREEAPMTSTTRRGLLRAAVAGAVLAPFAEMRSAFGATAKRDLYTRARFRRQKRSWFRVTDGRRSWRMRLMGVSNLSEAPAGDYRRFVLTFRTGVHGPPQGSYVFARKRFAATTLFVVPSDPQRRTYQAVISSRG
jgi:hypothetical protein